MKKKNLPCGFSSDSEVCKKR